MTISPQLSHILAMPEVEFRTFVRDMLPPEASPPTRYRRNLVGPVVVRTELEGHVVEFCRADERRGGNGIAMFAKAPGLRGHSTLRTAFNELPLESLCDRQTLRGAMFLVRCQHGKYDETLDGRTVSLEDASDGFVVTTRRFSGWKVQGDGAKRGVRKEMAVVDRIEVSHGADLDAEAISHLRTFFLHAARRPEESPRSVEPLTALEDGLTFDGEGARAGVVVRLFRTPDSPLTTTTLKTWLEDRLPVPAPVAP